MAQRLRVPNTEEKRVAPCWGRGGGLGCSRGAGAADGGAAPAAARSWAAERPAAARRRAAARATAAGSASPARAAGGVLAGRPRADAPASSVAVAGMTARSPPPPVSEFMRPEFVADRPARLLGRHLHALDQRGVVRLAPMRLHVAVAVGVEDAELHRVHADLVGQLVHLHLEREIDAVMPKPRMAVAGVRLVKTQ